MDTTTQVIDAVIFFDGVCNLCHASVHFIIERDTKRLFHFSSLQSEFSRKHLPQNLTKANDLQSLVLQYHGKILTKSTAALTIARHLSGPWPLLYAFIIIPPFLRNIVYDIIAKKRYRWFGKKDKCMVPSPELKARFVD